MRNFKDKHLELKHQSTVIKCRWEVRQGSVIPGIFYYGQGTLLLGISGQIHQLKWVRQFETFSA